MSREPFASYDHGSLCWRTSQLSLDGASTTFSGHWPKSGMTAGGHAYALLMSVLPTGENDGSLLPTPDAGGFNTGESLESWEARRDRNKAKKINGNGQGTPLGIAVQQLLATPVARDYKGIPGDNVQMASLPRQLGILTGESTKVQSPAGSGSLDGQLQFPLFGDEPGAA
jgi:hypothetical protein